MATDSTLYLYTSLTAGSSHIITATSRLETILKANKIPFQAIDVATDDAARKLWGRYSKGRKLPGLVKYKTIIGDLEQIEEWNEYGELKAEIGAVSDPLDFSTDKKPAVDNEKPKPLPPAVSATSAAQSAKSSGTSTPHIQIQNPPVKENKEDQRTLALRLAGEEAAARAKENAKAKLTAATSKPAVASSESAASTDAGSKKEEQSPSAVVVKPKEEDEGKAEKTKTGNEGDVKATEAKSTKQTEQDTPVDGFDSVPSAASGTRRRSVVPEIVPPSSTLKRPSLADEVAAVSSANFHADNAEILGLVGHHRGSIISATTQDEQDQVRKDIRASISEAPSDGDIDALRKSAEQREGDTIVEEEEEEEEEEDPEKTALVSGDEEDPEEVEEPEALEKEGNEVKGEGAEGKVSVEGEGAEGKVSEEGEGAEKIGPEDEKKGAAVGTMEGKTGEEGNKGAPEQPEAHIFVQMVAAFGLKDKFNEEFLRRLFVANGRKRELARFACVLGFEESLGGIVEELIKSGNVIEAIFVAHEADLLERFPPVPLLKSYLRNSTDKAQVVLKSGRHSSSALEEANNLEGNAYRSIIRCVESCQLQSVFPIEVMKKKLAKLEKEKSEKKKAAGPSRFQNKRSRGAAGPYPFPAAKAARGSNFGPRFQNPISRSLNYAAHAGYINPAVASSYYVPGSVSGRRGGVPFGGPGATYGGSPNFAAGGGQQSFRR